MSVASPLRLAIVGCGYVTRESHLPAAACSELVRVTALVDVDLTRAKTLAAEYDVPTVATDVSHVLDHIDAVVVAVPHTLHADIALHCLKAGRHVLLEKPMALSVAECDALVTTARQAGRVLAVGHMRRFYDAVRFTRDMLASGLLGRLTGFEAAESVSLATFPAGPSAVRPPAGGVLWDTGPHTLDLLLWFLGDLTVRHYEDDADGGVEAECWLELETADGVTGKVTLSRMRTLGNMIQLVFERGRLDLPTLRPAELRIWREGLAGPLNVRCEPTRDPQLPGVRRYFRAQLDDLADAVATGRNPAVTGEEGRRVVALIEACRAVRSERMAAEWSTLLPGVAKWAGVSA